MDGGIVESMLLGSAVGAGTSLLTGGDPLKGALTGGLSGGVMGGIMPGASATPLSSGLNPLDASGLSATAAMEGTGTGLLPGAGGMGFQPAGSMGFTAPGVTNAAANSGLDLANYTSPLSAGAGSATMDLSNYTSPLQDMASQGIAGSIGGMPTQLSAAGKAAAQANPEFLKDPLGWWKSLSKTEKMLYGGGAGLGLMMLSDRNRYGIPKQTPYSGPLSKFHYDPSTFVPSLPYSDGGITTLGGGNIAVGGDPRRNPAPISEDNTNSDGWQNQSFPSMHMADGGITSLGSYSDGGRLLKGPGDGMSDNIPATIGHKQPARLAEGEFVVPADVVSHLGNGSTDAGAKQLYAMMDKVRRARTGRAAQGREINPRKYMPA